MNSATRFPKIHCPVHGKSNGRVVCQHLRPERLSRRHQRVGGADKGQARQVRRERKKRRRKARR